MGVGPDLAEPDTVCALAADYGRSLAAGDLDGPETSLELSSLIPKMTMWSEAGIRGKRLAVTA